MITSPRRQACSGFALLISLLLPTLKLHAEIKPHALFCDNAVLQQGTDVLVWGIAGDGEQVTVEFLDQKVSTVAAGGQWKLALKPLKASATPSTMTITGSASAKPITFNNVVVGEVWIVSGQSNMAMGVGKLREADEVKAKCEDPMLRYFNVPWRATDAVQRE